MASRPAARRVVAVALAAACTAALCAISAPRAHAAPGIEYGLTDDAWLQDGPRTIGDRVATLEAIGVKVVRFSLRWNLIAPTRPANAADPTDPAYDWTSTSTVLDALHAAGLDVVAQLVGTPSWANGGKPPNYAPTSSSSFAAFAQAAAQEYPWIHKWLIWNEPNQAIWLRPTTPSVYVSRLLDPAYAAIHRAIPSAQVAGGGTAPRAASHGVSPVAWLLGMHAAHAHLDVYAHNPYPLDPRHETPTSGGCARCSTITMATLGKLEALVARDFPRARIWLTEYGYQTNPPDPMLGVTPSRQAMYQAQAAYVAYRAPRVDMLIHFLYQDEPSVARFQSGLATFRGVPKPSLYAFELPLAQTGRRGSTTTLWGELRAPAAGPTATLERRVGTKWRTIASINAGTGGFFRWRGTLPRRAVVRLQSAGITGPALTIS